MKNFLFFRLIDLIMVILYLIVWVHYKIRKIVVRK